MTRSALCFALLLAGCTASTGLPRPGAIDARVPFAWVTADEAYGQVKHMRGAVTLTRWVR